MRPLVAAFIVVLHWQTALTFALSARGKDCRSQPGDPGFPSQQQWQQLNSSVGGRLISVVPSAKHCHLLPSGNCTEEEWSSSTFRGTIPGAMNCVSYLFVHSIYSKLIETVSRLQVQLGASTILVLTFLAPF